MSHLKKLSSIQQAQWTKLKCYSINFLKRSCMGRTMLLIEVEIEIQGFHNALD